MKNQQDKPISKKTGIKSHEKRIHLELKVFIFTFYYHFLNAAQKVMMDTKYKPVGELYRDIWVSGLFRYRQLLEGISYPFDKLTYEELDLIIKLNEYGADRGIYDETLHQIAAEQAKLLGPSNDYRSFFEQSFFKEISEIKDVDDSDKHNIYSDAFIVACNAFISHYKEHVDEPNIPTEFWSKIVFDFKGHGKIPAGYIKDYYQPS